MQSQNLNDLSQYFYREIDGRFDFREQVLKFLPQIQTIGELDFLIYQANNFPAAYVSWLLMNVPEIFQSFELQDWLTLMAQIQREEKPKPYDKNDRTFLDISFLCVYLKIDALKLFVEHTDIAKKTKITVLEFLREHYFIWFNFDYDVEFINEEGSNTLHLLEDYTHKFFIQNPNEPIFNYSYDNIVGYCERLLNSLL